MLNNQWKQARELYRRAKKETTKQIIESGVSAGTASMAPRAWARKQRFKLHDWQYLAVCATLTIPDELFPDLCETMNINKDTPVRQVKNRIVAYRKTLPDQTPTEPVDRHGSDYVMVDGRKFWIPPALSGKIIETVEDYLNDADLNN